MSEKTNNCLRSLVVLLSLTAGLYFFTVMVTTMPLWYLLLPLIYTVVVNEIFLHQVCSHAQKPLNTKSWIYKLFTFLAAVDHGSGAVNVGCYEHQHHHNFPDQGKKDKLNARYYWYSRSSLSPLMYLHNTSVDHGDTFHRQQLKRFGWAFKDKWTLYCFNYSVIFALIYWLILYILFPFFLFYVVFVGRFMLSVILLMSTIFGHGKYLFGYQHNNSLLTNKTTYNQLWFHWMLLTFYPTALHNNHHSVNNYKHTIKWYEFCIGDYITLFFEKVLVKK